MENIRSVQLTSHCRMWTFEKNSIFFVLLVLFVVIFEAVDADDNNSTSVINKLSVKIFYEALCRDSMNFIRQQIFPFLIRDNNMQYANLIFLPYGKASEWRNPDTNITQLFCQHGPRECELNALHACIVQHNDQVEQLKMINCLLKSYKTSEKKCAEDLQIDISAAEECKRNNAVVDILHKYDKETKDLELSFVPAIVFNDDFRREEQESIFYYFKQGFCKAYMQTYNMTIQPCATKN